MDFSVLTTAVTAQVGDVFTAITPLLAIIISAGVGYGLFRRFVG